MQGPNSVRPDLLLFQFMEKSAIDLKSSAELRRKHHRKNADRAKQHRGLSRPIDAPAFFDQVRRQPAAADAADICDHVDRDQGKREAFDAEAKLIEQELAGPKQIKPPGGISNFSHAESPGLAQREN